MNGLTLLGDAIALGLSLSVVFGPLVAFTWVVLSAWSRVIKERTNHDVETIRQAAMATSAQELPSGNVFIKRWQGSGVVTEVVMKSVPQIVQSNAEPDKDAGLAARLIVASLYLSECDNKAHKHGPDGTQLLTQDECIAGGVFARPDDHRAAVAWLRANWIVIEANGKGNQGVFTRDELKTLLPILTALPKRKP